MVAKVIACGSSRDEARLKLVQALKDTVLFGVASNRDFLIDVLKQSRFAEGAATTAFISETYGDSGFPAHELQTEDLAVAAVVHHNLAQRRANAEARVSIELLDWSSAADLETILHYPLDRGIVEVRVQPRGKSEYQVLIEDGRLQVSLRLLDGNKLLVVVNGQADRGAYWLSASGKLFMNLGSRSFSVIDTAALESDREESGGGGRVVAPMHGVLLEVLVAEGDSVSRGDKLAVLEAMKMQHEILAEIDGVVVRVASTADSQLAANDLILEIESVNS
jgi:geranyl-CoA carboxylase alpha subunit